jgi:hypothetical protein
MADSTRGGKFSLPHDAVVDDFDLARRILSDVVVLRCEYRFSTKEFEYEAYSEHFDELAPGEALPDYDIEVVYEGEKLTNVIWKRREPNG